MPSSARLIVIALLLPPSLAAQNRFTLQGERVAIYNLAGEISLSAGSGSAVTVTATPQGAQAAALRFAQGEVRGHQALRVIYPEGDVVYPALGKGSHTTQRINDDGTFGDSDRGRGRRVRIVGSGSGTEAHANLALTVPAGHSVAVYLAAGLVAATNVNGTLEFDLSSASLKINGGKGAISADIGAGNVDISGTDGPLHIDTGSGNVRLTNVKAASLEIDAGSGNVAGSGVVAMHASIEAGSGDIELLASQAPEAELESGSGDITVELAAVPGNLDVETGSGDIVLRLPASTGAQVSIETSSGRIESDFTMQVTRTGRDELTGTIGDGAGRISAESGSGDVRLQKR
jgi:DUF4097 and DUF4098 domain-containing protein YvlB